MFTLNASASPDSQSVKLRDQSEGDIAISFKIFYDHPWQELLSMNVYYLRNPLHHLRLMSF